MQAGASGLNDELLRLSRDGATARAWPKPLSIKPGTAELFPEVAALTPDDGVPFRHVPLSAIGEVAEGPVPISSVLLLRRTEESEVGFEPISASAALVALIGNTMNFFTGGPERSLSTLAALVASHPCSYFDLGDPDASIVAFFQRVSTLQRRSLEWELIEATAPYMVEGVLTVRFEDEVVLWSPESSQAVALDRVGAQLWLDACHSISDRLVEFVDFARSLVDQGMLDLDRTLETKRLAIDSP
jgi:hypothetical protein